MAKVEGLESIIRRLKTVAGETAGGVERGLMMGAAEVFREAQRLVPIDTGNLKGSGSIRKEGSGFQTDAIISYGANYAIFVHENLEAQHAAPTQAKFLEQPARELRPRVVQIIRREAKIK